MPVNHAPQVSLEPTMEAFFYRQVAAAVAHQGVTASDQVRAYLVRLLTHFSHTENLFGQTEDGLGIKPLAFLYAEAIYANSLEQRNQALRRIGDIALFIAGVFPSSLNRSLVGIDYYIAMGGNAYSSLSERAGESKRWRSLEIIFDELAEKFVLLVDVLGEATEPASFGQEEDLLRLHELWARSGSGRLLKRLRALGITLDEEHRHQRH